MGRSIQVFFLFYLSIATVSVLSGPIRRNYIPIVLLRDSEETSGSLEPTLNHRLSNSQEFQRRSGVPASDESNEDKKSIPEISEITLNKRNLTAKPPPAYEEDTERNLRFPPKQKRSKMKEEEDAEFDEESDTVLERMDSEDSYPSEKYQKARFLWPFQLTVTKTKESKHKHSHHHHQPKGPPLEYKQPEPVPFHSFDPDLDLEIQKLRIEIYKGLKRWKKWKKINKHEYTELAALGLTNAVAFLEFI